MNKLTFALLLSGLVLMLCHSESLAQQKDEKVYWMSTVSVPFAKLSEYHTFMEKEALPVYEQNGYHYVAGWQTIIGDIEEVVTVAEFESLAAYQKARFSLLANPEWKALGPKMEGLTKGVRTRMMAALPYFKKKQ
jgi:hypothetical protein